MEGNGGACEVHQREGSQRDAKGIAGHRVYLSGSPDPFLEEHAGLVQPRDEEPVDYEPGPILADDDDLSHRLAILLHRSQSLC